MIELHAASAFSFLRGASTPEDLINAAASLDIPAMALLDRDGVYGAPRFHMAAKKAGIRAHIGAEISLRGADIPACPLLVETRTGYQNLCRLITLMKLRAPKGQGEVTLDEVEAHAQGLICLAAAPDEMARLAGIFGRQNIYAEIQRHFHRDEEARNQAVIAAAGSLGIPVIAANGARYATPSARELLDVLTCIRHKTTIAQAGRLLERNSERYLKPAAEMARLFADLPDAPGVVERTAELSARLEFSLEDLGYEFPRYPVPGGGPMITYLRQVTDQGARRRYQPYYPRARRQIERELALIEKLNLAGYFLIVWDLVNFCRDQGILVQGRGSAANSAVCYSLGITAVDPVGMELLFERFLSEERGEWPDIDLDLPSGDRRESVIQYIYRRYGERGAAMTANVITYRGRSAAREVGKVLGFDPETAARLSRQAGGWEWHDPKDTPERKFAAAGLDISQPLIRKFFELFLAIQDVPRHLGQHSGGMVICQGCLDAVVPLEPASMPGRVVVQWDKEDCADLGIIKVDLLGLGMMAVLEESLILIRDHYGEEVDLAHLPPDDPDVYAALQKADTIGMFQVESRAQQSCLPRLRPQKFYDLVVQVALIRPGPIVGQMVHPYLRRRQGREAPECLHPSLEPVLRRTLGVPLFQEQLLRMAMIAANFTGGQAEELRRALGFKRSEQRMREIETKLRAGMERNGITGKTQDTIVQSITAFALYGFPESHAASFALIAYSSAYLKTHYLAAFTAAIMNNQPMGFYSPATLVKDAQRHGLKVLPIDVTKSEWPCTIENKSLRMGLMYVRGLRRESGEAIARQSALAPFTSIHDLTERVPELHKDELRALSAIGALNFCGADFSPQPGFSPALHVTGLKSGRGLKPAPQLHRRDALWHAERAGRPVGPLLAPLREPEAPSPLARMTDEERLLADYRGTGMTLGKHPVAYRRAELHHRGVARACDLEHFPNGNSVRVAGAVIVRQRPGTAKGFMFLSLEDETGVANVIVDPKTFDHYSRLLTSEPFLLIEGALQSMDNTISVKARRIQSMFAANPLPEVKAKSFS